MSDSIAAAPIDFKAILEAAPDAVVVHDLNNRVLFWNQAAEALYGWTAQEIQGRPISRVLYLDLAEREKAMAVLTQGGVWRRELRQLDRNGDEYLVQVRQHLQCCVDGLPQAIVSFNTDVTEQRKLADAQERAHHVQSSSILAGGVAHDFNNVLTAIIGFSDLLLASHRPSDPSFQDIMNIKQNANRAAGLVRQLLAFSRRQTLRPKELALNDVLADLSILLDRLLSEKVELSVVHGRDLWPVMADLNHYLLITKLSKLL